MKSRTPLSQSFSSLNRLNIARLTRATYEAAAFIYETYTPLFSPMDPQSGLLHRSVLLLVILRSATLRSAGLRESGWPAVTLRASRARWGMDPNLLRLCYSHPRLQLVSFSKCKHTSFQGGRKPFPLSAEWAIPCHNGIGGPGKEGQRKPKRFLSCQSDQQIARVREEPHQVLQSPDSRESSHCPGNESCSPC